MAARPMAATRMSASRQTAGRSGVFEWQIVTVACSCSSSIAAGLPTMSLRPTTTARCPAIAMPAALQQFDDARRGAGSRRRQPGHQRADIARMEAVHVLGRRYRHQNSLGVHLRRQRQLHQNAVDLRARIQPLDNRQQFCGGNGIRRRDRFGINPQIVAGLDLVADVDFARPDPGPPALRPTRGDGPWRPAPRRAASVRS